MKSSLKIIPAIVMFPPKLTSPPTSMSPSTNKSFRAFIMDQLESITPSSSITLNAALPDVAPTRKVVPKVKTPEMEVSPTTSSFASGVVFPIPIRSFVASIDNVSVSKLNPFVPPLNVKLVSLLKVQTSAFDVTVSPVAFPRITSPSILKFPVSETFPWMSKSASGVLSFTPMFPEVSTIRKSPSPSRVPEIINGESPVSTISSVASGVSSMIPIRFVETSTLRTSSTDKSPVIVIMLSRNVPPSTSNSPVTSKSSSLSRLCVVAAASPIRK